MKSMVTVKYPAGHSYDYVYEKCDTFCPCCGKQQVWVDTGEGDYCQGPNHICLACKSEFTLPSSGPIEGVNTQIVTQLRELDAEPFV